MPHGLFDKKTIKIIFILKKIKNNKNSVERAKKLRMIRKTHKRAFRHLRDAIKKVYDDGYGYKSIAKNLDITYMVCRWLLNDFLNIKTRKGMNQITEKLKELRSENVKGDKNHFYNWPKKYPNLHKVNGKGIQGYFWNSSLQKYVWLRSSYEYIYAKWLNSKNIIWDVEVEYFKLSNGENYLPDFFIYDKKKKLVMIVEIKGNYSVYNREKHTLLSNDITTPVSLINDIKLFLSNGKKLNEETEEWKQLRVLKLEK